MKKMFKFMKAVMLSLMAAVMFLGTGTITANAQPIINGCMTVAEDGRVKDTCLCVDAKKDTKTGKIWNHTTTGRPFVSYDEEVEIQKPNGRVVITIVKYFDCYLSDYVKTHDESEWPDFVIKGSDGIPFYYSETNNDGSNYEKSSIEPDRTHGYIVRYCYDEASDEWLYDKSYRGPFHRGWGESLNIEVGGVRYKTVTLEEHTEQTKADIANGKEVNGKAGNPEKHPYDDNDRMAEYNPEEGTVTHPDGSVVYPDGHTEYPDGRIKYPDGHTEHPDGSTEYPDGHIEYPDGRVEYPDGRIEYPDGHTEYKYADINTLGATVTFSTDCIKVKTNKKGVVAQKPLPKSVKVGGKALKRNKTFVVSYEKYDDGTGWRTVDAVTDEGIYRLVITGQNGYEGVYMKRLYVTADKTIKAMSSVTVKVNKVNYSSEPVTSGVIKSAKVGKRTLEEGVDYTVTYTNNTNSGTAQATLTAVEGSGLLGTKTVNYTIVGLKMNKVKVTGLQSLVYDPNTEMVQNMRDVQLTHNNGNVLEGDDFTVAYANNTKAGTAKIMFTGKGLYNGTLTKTFKITKMPLSDSMLDEASKNIELTYTKKALKPEVKLTVGGTELKKGTDYTLAYSNNVKVSTEEKPAWITVKGKGNYSGSFKVSFTIIPEVDDNAAKPNTTGILSTKEVPEEDDTVSGNSVEDETPETDDTVSGNDIADDTGSENDVTDDADKSDGDETIDGADKSDGDETTDGADKSDEDETIDDADKSDGDETIDDADKSDEDETTDDVDKSDEDEIIDDRNTDNESADDESKSDDESVVFETKPIGFVVCDCGCIMPFYTYGMSDAENETWSEHLYEHMLSGWQVHYDSVSYEKALECKMISEDSDGRWTLLQGTLLMPPEVKLEKTGEPQIEETAESAVAESQIEESAVEVTEESEAEVDSDKPVGEGTDYIENYF